MVTLNALPVDETDAEIFESDILFVDKLAAVKIADPFKNALPFISVVPSVTINPFANVPIPALDTLNNVFPLLTLNADEPTLTDADTEPVAILLKFNPVIPVAGMLNKLAPDPLKIPSINKLPVILTEPVKFAGPILINVFDPDTINEPVITLDPITINVGAPSTDPESIDDPVILSPELELIVPANPVRPLSPF